MFRLRHSTKVMMHFAMSQLFLAILTDVSSFMVLLLSWSVNRSCLIGRDNCDDSRLKLERKRCVRFRPHFLDTVKDAPKIALILRAPDRGSCCFVAQSFCDTSRSVDRGLKWTLWHSPCSYRSPLNTFMNAHAWSSHESGPIHQFLSNEQGSWYGALRKDYSISFSKILNWEIDCIYRSCMSNCKSIYKLCQQNEGVDKMH